jgi:hypothetical protein
MSDTYEDQSVALLDQVTDTVLEVERLSFGRPPVDERRHAAMRDIARAQAHATLSISEELRSVRADVADLAAAVRELADAIRTQPRRRWFSRRTEASR